VHRCDDWANGVPADLDRLKSTGGWMCGAPCSEQAIAARATILQAAFFMYGVVD
jgi:hypothetical protein